MPKRFTSDKGPSQRQLRAGELIRHALAEIFQREELRDPSLRGVSVTVSEVRASPDLKQATVFCTALGGEKLGGEDQGAVVKALNAAAPRLRSELGRRIDMKFTPQLSFRYDASFDEAERIDALLARPDVARDLPGEDGEN